MAELLSLKDSKTTDSLKRVLLIGDPGTGKTRFLSTMPKPFVAEFDPAGLESVVGLGVDISAKVFSIDATGWKEFKQELELWKKSGPQYGCSTFAVDSLTTASEAALEYVMSKNGNKKPTLPDWGEAIQETKDMMADMSALKCHTALTAHLQVTKDEVLGGLEWLPLVYGQTLPSRVPIYFSEVYHTVCRTELKGGVPAVSYKVQTIPDQRVKFVKSRANKDNRFAQYEDPDFGLLMEKATKQPK